MSSLCSRKKSPPTEEPPAAPPAERAFGHKSIAFFAGLCLVTNNTTGAGMVQIPAMFVACGWLYPTICFALVAGISIWAGLFLTKAISRVDGNSHLEKRVEYNEITQTYLPRWAYLVSMTALLFNFQASNISSIVLSAQVTDSTLLATAKMTCGIVFYPPQYPPYECITHSADRVTDSPFGDKYVASLGLLICAVIALPLGVINLEDNMAVQIASFVLLIVCEAAWVVQFFYSGLQPDFLPAVNPHADFSAFGPAFATVVFNYGFVTTIPSWLNEKKKGVSVPTTITLSVAVSYVLFMILGVLGGLSMRFPGGEDLLAAIMQGTGAPDILSTSRIACYIFPYVACLSGIPVFSIIIRYNLVNEGVPLLWANLFAVVLPWALSLFFYAGDQLALVISWSSAILFVYLNFCLPLIVFLRQSHEHGHDDPNSPRRGLASAKSPRPLWDTAASTVAAASDEDSAIGGGRSDWLLAESPPSHFVTAHVGSLQQPEKAGAWAEGWLGADDAAPPEPRECEEEVGECTETVASTLRVVPHIPCLSAERQPGPLAASTGLLVLTTLLAVACFAMQLAQVFTPK